MVERVDELDRVVGVVERGEAVRRGWLHRVATTVCRDAGGRLLVHRRADGLARFPGQYNWLVGGAVDVGESWEEAAGRELTEELGVRVDVRFAFKFLCRGAISPYWLGVHEAVVAEDLSPDPAEIAWHGWVSDGELQVMARQLAFVPDGVEVLRRYQSGS
nr:NUDIX domain-containing protein [Streptomyces sp. SID12488]